MKPTGSIVGTALFLSLVLSCNGTQFGGGSKDSQSALGESQSKSSSEDQSRNSPITQVDSEVAGKGPMTAAGNPLLNQCLKQKKSNQTKSDSPDEALSSWSDEVTSCLGDNKFFDFATNTCRKLNRPTRFECTWDSVIKRLKSKNLLNEDIKKASQDGLLLSCAESADGNRILTQSIDKAKLEDLDCSDPAAVSGSILTGCFTMYQSTRRLPRFGSDDDVMAEVAKCLREESR